MGLDTSHDCWHGPYSAFSRWRDDLAKAAGIPLQLMENFFETRIGSETMEWAAPRDGGPLCRSPHGPALHAFVERVSRWLPVRWESLRPDILHVLLNHSDCDGLIEAKYCGPLADRLAELLPLLPQIDAALHVAGPRARTQTFIDGLRAAAAAGEDVEFH